MWGYDNLHHMLVINYYLRRNNTNENSDREIINTITFEIEEESIIEFSVNMEKYQN